MITAKGSPGTCHPIGTYMGDAGSQSHIVISNTNGIVGTISTFGSSTAYNTTSDYRIKENVVSMDSVESIDKVSTLNPVTFTFKPDPSTVVSGFIAHEVKDVYPDCVTGDKDAVDADGNMIIQSMDYGRITPLLCSALKGVIDKMKELSSNFAALQSEFQDYKAAHP
jgi:Chaperone of endosialidase